MRSEDVIDVLDRLDAAGVEWRVNGGWGVDALLGHQTREHRDLDLRVRTADVGRIEDELAEFRRVDTGEWPRFLVLEDEHGRRVDLELAGLDGPHEHGRIGGREVRCSSRRYQVAHARGRDAEALRSRMQHP